MVFTYVIHTSLSHCSTGLWVPNIPQFEGVEHTVVRSLIVSTLRHTYALCYGPGTVSSLSVQGYESMSINPEDFENKVVLILGRGMYAQCHNCISHCNLIHKLNFCFLQVMLDLRLLTILYLTQLTSTW